MGMLDRLLIPTDEVKFISQTLADYRETRKVYHYDYAPEDLKALQACAKDLRPFTWSLVPSLATWFASGKLIRTKGRALPVRVALGIARLFATGQVFRIGYLAGSYRQTTGCMRSLVSLPTPLGGEIVALIRARNPEHPYLKYEKPPSGFEFSEGTRPRIATEANRAAQIAKFRKELDAAKGGQRVQKEGGEVLDGIMQQQQHHTLDDMVSAQETYEGRRRARLEAQAAASATVTSSSGRQVQVTAGPKGLVITDSPTPAWDEPHAAAPSTPSAGSMQGGVEEADGVGGEEFFDVLGAGAAWEEEAGGAEEQKQREQQARRERRRGRWGRLRRRTAEGESSQRRPAPEGSTLEGSD